MAANKTTFNTALRRCTVPLLCAAATAVCGFFAQARQIQYPRSCYSDAELENVREWEKTWAAKRIDKSTVGHIAGLLPESYVRIYSDPEKWGAPEQGFFFFIGRYRYIRETRGMCSATLKYAPGVVMGSDGTLPNYAGAAGMPFPEPQSGLEIAWNFDFNTHGDSCFYNRTGYNIVPRKKTERVGDQDAWELFWIHRVDVDPRPAFSENPKGISRSTFYHMYTPPEFKNTRMFNLRFIDPLKSDDAYMWYSSFRRIQRISTSQRTDSIDGTDLIYDDEYFWDGQILRNSYTLKGTRDLLCARHTDIRNTIRQEGQALLNGVVRERLKTYVVEVTSRDPSYIYARRLWYVDPETYLILWTEIYDDLNRFWKCFENLTSNIPTASGEEKNFIVGSHFIDFQRTHAGTWRNTRIAVGLPIRKEMFSLYNLRKHGY